MQFGGFSSDFERLARLDVTGQLDLPADARQRLQTEEAAIRHDMDRLWTAYMPSISPGEEAERAAALKSAWGDFGATERRLEGLEQAGDHTGAAGRSEEHTSELQSLMRISYAVFCFKKKKN